MAIQKEFEDFVRAKNKEATEKPRVDWDARKAAWIKQVNGLYDKISVLLSDYIDKGTISVARNPIQIAEERLGTYSVDELSIEIGENTVRLVPVGTIIIGASGRVDLIGERGRVRVILTDPEAGSRSADIKILKPGQRPPDSRPVDLNVLEWKLVSDPPDVKIRELTKTSLFEAILAVANE